MFFKQSAIALALATLASSAIAEPKFLITIPLISQAQSVKDISVTLRSAGVLTGFVNVPYAQNLRSLVDIQGDPNVNRAMIGWQVAGSLPEGLTFDRGVISGTPVRESTSTITVTATYKTKQGVQSYTIPITLSFSVADSTTPEYWVDTAITPLNLNTLVTSAAQVDTSELTWSATNLPAGLVLSNSGVLSGTPTEAYSGSFTVTARRGSATASGDVAALVLKVSLSLTPPTSQSLLVGQPFTFELPTHVTVTGDPAFDASKLQFTAANLPEGITLTSSTLSGTPTTVGTKSASLTGAYKGRQATATTSFTVQANLVEASGAKRWSDGSSAESCNDYKNPKTGYLYSGATGDGTYWVKPASIATAFQVKCDQTTDGGGWTVFQHRSFNDIGFYRGRAEYLAGFGSVAKDHWLGLEKMRALILVTRELRVDLGRANGARAYAKYSSFTLGAAPGYAAKASGYNGTAGDSLLTTRLSTDLGFSTYDYDVDWLPGENCSVTYKGAWWYGDCHLANLNGIWYGGAHSTYADGINWNSWTGYYESLTYTEMKVR